KRNPKNKQDTHVNLFRIATRQHCFLSGVAVAFGDFVAAFPTESSHPGHLGRDAQPTTRRYEDTHVKNVRC
ncbi:MAG: hypothetical protein ACW7DS_17130, partial [Paraglaciecola chathamensis]